MKAIITLPAVGEKRTITHISRIEILPDDDSTTEHVHVNVDTDIADDGGLVIVITEEEHGD